jgi:hypothetical protein
VLIALVLASCVTGRPPGRDDAVVTYTHEVHIPADPHTPLAAVLPGLHMMAARLCPRRYDIVDRRMRRTLRSTLEYNPTQRTLVPDIEGWAEIIATIRCLEP